MIRRIRDADGSWWYQLNVALWARVETHHRTADRITGEPAPILFLAPAATVTPIKGQDYRGVSTWRHPATLRRTCRKRLEVPGKSQGDTGGDGHPPALQRLATGEKRGVGAPENGTRAKAGAWPATRSRRQVSCPEFRSGRLVWFQAAFVVAWDRWCWASNSSGDR